MEIFDWIFSIRPENLSDDYILQNGPEDTLFTEMWRNLLVTFRFLASFRNLEIVVFCRLRLLVGFSVMEFEFLVYKNDEISEKKRPNDSTESSEAKWN